MTDQTASHILTLGTRGSKLALAQTEIIASALRAAHPDLTLAIERITTRGDIVLDRPLNEIGGKGLFVVEIEDALRAGRIDAAVHSGKDLPGTLPADMMIAAFPRRADPRDVLIAREGHTLAELPQGARIGTSSARRACQIRHLRPDLAISELRGNVDTRLRKLREGQYDAIVLAAAGLDRLGLADVITEYLDPTVIIPAPAQGAIVVEARANDAVTQALLAPLDDPYTRIAVSAERVFLATIGGGCAVPLGAYAQLQGDEIAIAGMIGTPDGQVVTAALTGPLETAADLGRQLAETLLASGGRDFLTPDEEQAHA